MNALVANLMSDWVHMALASAILVLSLFFLWHVVAKGLWLIAKLRRLRKRIHQLVDYDPRDIKYALTTIFERTRWLEQWREYEETLHEQFDRSGPEPRVVNVRATTTADNFFNTEVLVEAPLHTEFYKHLPGILTGVGIIATFFGLITGLQQFDASATDPDELKRSLGGLFGYVRNAFLFSAVAIGLAMLFTMVEKIIYAICLHHATGITLEIDRLFRAGVGEEYLSKLVRSSEEGATQTKQLKESLVEDLKALLTNISERQIQATQQLSTDLGTSIQRSLETPLQRIAESVATTTRGQSEQSAKLLEDLMSSFLAQMRESLGGQLSGLSEMMQESARAMGKVEGALVGLVADMEHAGQASSSGVQSAMKELLVSLANHQREQGETSAAQQATALSKMQETVVRLADVQKEASRHAYDAAQAASERIGIAAEGAIKSSQESVLAANHLIASVGQVSTRAIDGLETGAAAISRSVESLGVVAGRFDGAAGVLASLHEKATQTTHSLEKASGSFIAGAQAIAGATVALGQATERLEDVSTLQASEAQVREATLQRIHEVLQSSTKAAEQFSQLSRDVEAQLSTVVGQFGDATVKVLNDVLKQYDNSLGGTVSMLKDTMGELAILVDSLNDKLRA